MAGIEITSVNRQVKDISQEIYAAKFQRDEQQAKSVNENRDVLNSSINSRGGLLND